MGAVGGSGTCVVSVDLVDEATCCVSAAFSGVPSLFPGSQLSHVPVFSGWPVCDTDETDSVFGLSGRCSCAAAGLSTATSSFPFTDTPDCDLFLPTEPTASDVALTIVVVALIGIERFDVDFPNVWANEEDLWLFNLCLVGEGGPGAVMLFVGDPSGATLEADEILSRCICVSAGAFRGHVRASHDFQSVSMVRNKGGNFLLIACLYW